MSREHASGYMRRPCDGHGMGCWWLLSLKPNTGGDKQYENQTQLCHFKLNFPADLFDHKCVDRITLTDTIETFDKHLGTPRETQIAVELERARDRH